MTAAWAKAFEIFVVAEQRVRRLGELREIRRLAEGIGDVLRGDVRAVEIDFAQGAERMIDEIEPADRRDHGAALGVDAEERQDLGNGHDALS